MHPDHETLFGANVNKVPVVLVHVCVAVIKTTAKNKLEKTGEEGVCFILQLMVHPWEKPRLEPKAETREEHCFLVHSRVWVRLLFLNGPGPHG